MRFALCTYFFCGVMGGALAGCAPNRTPGQDIDDPMNMPTDPPPRPGVLTISPNPIDLQVAQSPQRVNLTVRSSSYGDVTKRASLSLSNAGLGSGAEGVLTVNGGLKQGGQATLTATFQGQTGSAVLRVKVIGADIIDAGAPGNPRGYFGGAGGAAPSVVYPLAETLIPRNISQLRFQWTGSANAQVYWLRLSSPTHEQNVYLGTQACQGTQCGYQLPAGVFADVLRSNAGGALTLTVSQSPGMGMAYGSSAPLAVSVSPEDVRGGLYYWSTSIQGIYRVPIGASMAQVFVNGQQRGCAGCHSVSRDGKKVALQFGGPGGGAVVDGADANKTYVAPNAAGQWTLQTFNPSGDLLMVNNNSQARIIKSDTGALVTEVPTGMIGGRIAQPEWSPDGNSIVFVRYPAEGGGSEWNASNTGDIMTMPYNNGQFGAPTLIVASTPNQEYHWYPSWTPDSQWIVFITGKVPCQGNGGGGCNTYAPKNSVLRLVRAMAGQKPLELTRATIQAGLAVSWPRVAPFSQNNGRLVFFTFSARFPYGHSQPSQNQIWMAGVDLDKAVKNPGQDPSFSPFWLPFQQAAEDNHLGTWTTDVACSKKSDCPAEFDCVNNQCVPGLG